MSCIDLVVVNYHTPGELRRFLEAYESSFVQIPHTLHVVNVCPDEADETVLEDFDFDFDYSALVVNQGYSGACNYASTMANGDVIAFFNADTELRPDVVETCYENLMQDHYAAVVGPKQVSRAGRITHAGIFGPLNAPRHRAFGEPDRNQYEGVQDCTTVSGSAYFVKRSIWDVLRDCPGFRDVPSVKLANPQGAFLPTPHYYEETYLSYHAQAHGYVVKYVGTAKMIHDWDQQRASNASNKHWQTSQAMFREACDFHGIDHD